MTWPHFDLETALKEEAARECLERGGDSPDVMMCGHLWSDYELRPAPVRRGLGVILGTDPAPLRMFDSGHRVGGYRPCVRCRECLELYYAKQTAIYPDGYMGVTWQEVNEHAWLMFCCSWSVLACAAFLRSVS